MTAPPLDLVETLLILAGILFSIIVACEWLRDDMRYVYQGVLLLVTGAICLVSGYSFFTGVTSGADTIILEPIGGVLGFFGGMCALLVLIVWLPKILAPYSGRSDPSISQHPQQRPRGPGGV